MSGFVESPVTHCKDLEMNREIEVALEAERDVMQGDVKRLCRRPLSSGLFDLLMVVSLLMCSVVDFFGRGEKKTYQISGPSWLYAA